MALVSLLPFLFKTTVPGTLIPIRTTQKRNFEWQARHQAENTYFLLGKWRGQYGIHKLTFESYIKYNCNFFIFYTPSNTLQKGTTCKSQVPLYFGYFQFYGISHRKMY